MLKNFKFANVNAKVKGMYSKFLKYEDYEELVKHKTIKEVIVFLKVKYRPLDELDYNANRQEIEKVLLNLLKDDIKKIYPLLNNDAKNLLELYLQKLNFEYKNRNEITILNEEKENVFYIEYFDKLYKGVKKFKENDLTDLVGKQIDLINLLWTIRLNKYFDLQNEIPIYYKLPKDILEELKKESLRESAIKKTIYERINLDDDIEKQINIFLYRLYLNIFKTKPFSLTMLIAYIELKQIQIKNIITIIEGINYKVDNEKILKKLII